MSPTPTARRTGGLLIYDGDCAFCKRSAKWIRSRLPAQHEVRPWQQLELEHLGLDRDQVDRAAYWIDAHGRKHRGHMAILRAVEAAGGGWGAAARVSLLPPISWLGAGVYALVARNRHRMPGGSDECVVDDD